jgi:hypothetical protein
MLAVALLTSGKQTNFLLPMLWLIAAWPSLGYLRLRPGLSGVVVGCAILVSALPLVSLNWWHGGNWAGVPTHPGLDWTWRWTKTELTSPLWGVIGNAMAIPMQNLAPPFFPVYEAWNHWWQHFTQTPAGRHLLQFEDFGHLSSFQAPESGLGLFLCLFLLVSLLWVGIACNGANSRPGLRASAHLNVRLLRLVPWGLLLIFMAKVGAYQNARHLAPYYPFLLSSILALPLFSSLARRALWQRMALFPMAATAGIMVASPVTPLFPIPATLHYLGQHFPHSKVISRCESFYATSEIEHELRRPFDKNLPSEGVIGYATTIQGQEPGLWHPFVRRVERVCLGDSLADLHQRGIDYLVVDTFYLDMCGCTIAELMQRYEAQMVDQISYSRGWNRSSDYFYLVRQREGMAKDLRANNQ